jgi:hypothetical protein
MGRKRRLRAYGRWTPRVSPREDVVAHIKLLVSVGMSVQQISGLAGVSYSPVYRSAQGRQSRFEPHIAQRILAVKPQYRWAIGTARRLQALAVIGWGLREIAKALDVHASSVREYRRPRPATARVTLPIHTAVAALYDDLTLQPAPASREASLARANAREQGWHPPEAWDDATIDDFGAQPYAHLADPGVAGYVDWVKLDRARLPQGHPSRTAFHDLTWAEQMVLYREHLERPTGNSDRAFVARYRPVPIKLLRRLREEAG